MTQPNLLGRSFRQRGRKPKEEQERTNKEGEVLGEKKDFLIREGCHEQGPSCLPESEKEKPRIRGEDSVGKDGE